MDTCEGQDIDILKELDSERNYEIVIVLVLHNSTNKF